MARRPSAPCPTGLASRPHRPQRSASMAKFPSLKARQLLRVLNSEPLSYRIVRQSGSHRRLEAPGRRPITFSFHDRQTIRPATVKRILCKQVGLTEDEARRLL
jgi:predicted RNA binding protein YcfA (HicA-like mRNA interferase family)